MSGVWTTRLSTGIDRVAEAVSPRWYAGRMRDKARAKLAGEVAQFGYDAIQRTRLQTKRTGLAGTGDSHLTESALTQLRNICRDMGRNNPLVKGLLLSEADDIVGAQTKIEARTKSKTWNERAEALFRDEMQDRPCEATGRLEEQPRPTGKESGGTLLKGAQQLLADTLSQSQGRAMNPHVSILCAAHRHPTPPHQGTIGAMLGKGDGWYARGAAVHCQVEQQSREREEAYDPLAAWTMMGRKPGLRT